MNKLLTKASIAIGICLCFGAGVAIHNEDTTSATSVNAATQLTDPSNIVTTGDGLYADTYEAGRYVYKGANPNNYIQFNNELWRIIAVESDGSLKVIMNDIMQGDGMFPGYSYPNNWPISYTNTFLNDEYYGSLSEEAKTLIIPHSFNVGESKYNLNDLEFQLYLEGLATWTGKVGFIQASDFIMSNSNIVLCGTAELHFDNRSTCRASNYMTRGDMYQTVTSDMDSSQALFIGNSIFSDSVLQLVGGIGIRPVVYLDSNNVMSSGTGVSTDPYIVSEWRDPSHAQIAANINSALALSLDTNELSLNPTPNGGTNKGNIEATVGTNNINGYVLSMSIVDSDSNTGGSGNNTSLNYANTSDNFAITSTSSVGELGNNTWGYNVGKPSAVTNFMPIPAFNAPDVIKSISGLAADDKTSVTFGAKVNMDTVAGVYKNGVRFTVVSNI